MMKSHEITPTYLFSYLSFLLLPLVLQLRASARHCLVDCTGCSTRRGREGTPLAQQDVDAKARRSLKTLARRHAAHSTMLVDLDLDDLRMDWRWPCDL